jgi:hypothetical protein
MESAKLMRLREQLQKAEELAEQDPVASNIVNASILRSELMAQEKKERR